MAKKHRKRNQAKKAYGRKPKKQKPNYEQMDRMYEEWEAYDDEVFEKMFAEWEDAKEDAQ